MSVCDDRVHHEARQSYEALRTSLFTEQESRWLEEIWKELQRVADIADKRAEVCADACRRVELQIRSEFETVPFLQDQAEMSDSDADFYDGFIDGCRECVKAIKAVK